MAQRFTATYLKSLDIKKSRYYVSADKNKRLVRCRLSKR